ncbi:2,4-dichlorophenol 6-monooxygenase [Sphaerisporangium krabiense]|uniref:2,4-dichlorophenol 6-monooxygenase n=1 Tax=Sphaerisporangium krabiense TaxID=763782 RepID=A0A7W8Z5N1_9ACTN|nr:FAD-dependent monooxygenase [Sphaerisporangium krabiense]MBB5627929.1 2,4-dichlorophenol 6-monooxygenase [Sphaerisporangium krabiense]GII62089.1 2,4-dichlorophenol 6-monooxygenase [Sphaerisporangium krabiense]
METEVLIVGAGPAGAAASALLSTYGIANVVINKYPSVSNTPRAHITNQRGVEVFRDLGLEGEVVKNATPQHLMGEHVYGTSLAGRELGRLRTWYTHPHFKAEHDLASPSAVCDLPQHILEPILLNAAAARGSSVRFNTELLTFTQDDDGVTAVVKDRLTGGRHEIRAKYLIGADGGNSTVVEQLGLPLVGKMGLGGSINVVFEADLSRFAEHRPGDMYWFIQPGVGHDGNGIGVLRMVRPWTRWIGVWGYDVAAGEPSLTEADGVRIAHQLIGDDTVPVKVESISTWAVNDVYATDNMKGRVFCVGDAVHRHSPMNGLGSNTSMQDSYNLCWKLMMVLRGQAAPSLLDSYREERLPVAKQIVQRAKKSDGLMPHLFMALQLPPASDAQALRDALDALDAPTPEATERRRAFDAALHATIMCFNTHGVETNQHYTSGAIVSDGTPDQAAPRDEEIYYFATSRPGRHLPHVWVTRDQHRVSTFDLCGRGRFTLLTGINGAAWRDAAELVSKRFGVPLRVHSIGRGCDYEDSYGDYQTMSEVGEDGVLLIRPDHMVAWRAASATEDPEATLAEVMAEILGR